MLEVQLFSFVVIDCVQLKVPYSFRTSPSFVIFQPYVTQTELKRDKNSCKVKGVSNGIWTIIM
jgi:hypothetical protein